MIKERTDLAPGRLDGALCGLAQQVLELGEDLLNGGEIRAVRREEEEPCAGGSDQIANGRAFVRAEIVEDHDIPRLQSCDQYFFDIKTEALGVDRAVEDPWRVDTVMPKGGQEGHRLPMAIRHLGVEPLPASAPAAQRGHIGLGPSFVDEDEAFGIDPRSSSAPVCGRCQNAPRDAIAELYDLFRDLDRRIGLFDKKIDRIFHENEACQRIAKIKGVGPKTATAIVAAIGDGSEFKNGRHLAAWVGLVPRQFSSGDRKVLMGISKRGNQHLRTLLVHGARAVVRTAPRKTDLNNQWVNQIRERCGFNRATVAVANKNARIIWAVLRMGEPYRAAF